MVLPYDGVCAPGELGMIASGLNNLEGNRINEVWAVAGAEVSRGSSGRCQWSKTPEIFCAAIWINPEQCQTLDHATQVAYEELLDLLYQFEYKHPFRFWNYLPNINIGEHDTEQYKQFCIGRLKAFQAKGIPNDQFPAASALGHHTQGAVIYVIADRSPAIHHKNALQVNAYEYPREYGISSPSFSRATSITIGKQPLFFISGTASIIGHETKHTDNLSGQLQTTTHNILQLLEQANSHKLPLQSMKVYLRYAEDYGVAKQQLEKHFPAIPKLFTLADICRVNLLVEVECFCS